MADFFRDTAFGTTVRFLTGNRVLGHAEDKPDFKFDGQKPHDDRRGSQDTLTNDESQPKAEKTRVKDDGGVESGAYNPHDERPKPKDDDPTVVGWYGDDDPANPENWSTSRKLYATGLLGLYTTSVYICSAIYTPGYTQFMMEFPSANVYVTTLGLTMFVIGYGVSPMIFTPMTAKPEIGKLWPYLITFFLFIAFCIGSAASPTPTGFIIQRFLAGFFGSPAISTVGASLNDIWGPLIAPRAIGVWGSSASLGPILGPLIGAACIDRFGTWRSPLYLNACVASFTFILMFFTLPETSAPVILHRRFLRVRRVTGRKDLTTEWKKSGADVSIGGTIMGAIKISIDPTVLYMNTAVAIAYLVLYSWFETFPATYVESYGFTEVQQGLIYLFIGVAVIIAVACYIFYLIKWVEPAAAEHGGLQPNSFVNIGKAGVIALPISLFWFAWTAGRTHWAIPSVATMPFGVGIFYIFMFTLNSLAISFYPHLLSIYALNAFFRSVFAAVGPIYAQPAIQNIGVAWFTTILAVASLFLVPLPFLYERYGKTFRVRSKYAVDEPEDEKKDGENNA